jgi:hypothetical protein
MAARLSRVTYLLIFFGSVSIDHTVRAQDGIEVRAARVCAGMGQMNSTGQGALKIDNFDLQATTNGTVTIKRDGVDLGKVERGTYESYRLCLTEVMRILASAESRPTTIPSPTRTPAPPPPSSRIVYKTCTGSFEPTCPSHDVFFPCGADVAAWARNRCGTYSIRRLAPDSYGGDRCGYTINEIICENLR